MLSCTRRLALALVAACCLAALLPAGAAAHPVFGEPWQLRQPDGSLVDVVIWGDEFYQDVETPDGYALVRDPTTQVICYARLSADRQRLESTGVRVGTADPARLGLAPHLRIEPAARQKAALENRRLRETIAPPDKGAFSPAITGNVTGLCLLVDFSDQTATIARDDVENFCNQVGYTGFGNNGSVRDYFFDVSEGHLTYTSDVNAAYHRASHAFTWYDDTSVGWLDRAKQLIYEILDAMDAAGTDFSQYDSNGDGYIDAINLFYAGNTSAGWAQGMWPGSGWFQDAWSADGVATLKYQITGMGNSLSIETYIHENGHMLGFWPDLYDYGHDSAGVGMYCIMSNGGSGTNPIEPCAYFKVISGWADLTTYSTRQLGIPAPVSTGNRVYKFPHPSLSNEYWLVENRQRSGRDSVLPDDGLFIWHIDENGDHNANEMTPASHFLVTLVQADGDWDLENNVNSGDNTDIWAAPDFTHLIPSSDPNTNWWSGDPSGFMFTNISASGPAMTFDFSPANEAPVAVCQDLTVHPGEGCCATIAVADIDGGSYDPNGAGDVQSLCITAVDGGDVGCVQQVELCGVGEYELTLTITDLAGVVSSCTATVELVNQAPVAVCRTFSAEADTDCCIEVTVADIDGGSYDPDGAADVTNLVITAVDGVALGAYAETVEVCGAGLHAVTLLITDHCSASATCDASVTVVDVTPPTITAEVDRDVLWPPNHKMCGVTATVVATDNCDADPLIELVSVTCDEADDGLGDGRTSNDIVINADERGFSLRAERQGGGDGRVYTITYRATDDSGNSATTSCEVRVPHDHAGWAVAATGFTSDGAALAETRGSFMLVVHSRAEQFEYDASGNPVTVAPAFDALSIDSRRAYVGNSWGVAAPISALQSDVDADGRKDLLLVYPVPRVIEIMTGSVPGAEGAIDPGNKFGPIGLHYRDAGGVDYLVPNIFALGPRVSPTPGRDPSLPDQPAGKSALPAATGALAAHPNPFNPTTTVTFDLAREEMVSLTVYDLQGRRVRTLASGPLPAGSHRVVWDGRTEAGARAPAGIYLVHLAAGQYRGASKLALIK